MAHHRVNIGIIGCGHIAHVHAMGYGEISDQASVVAACDIDKASAERFAARHGIPETTNDYATLLRRSDIDGVDIILPHHMHKEVATAAAQAGKHILVEKPIACTLEEADAMIAAAEKYRVLLMVAHNERYAPEHREIKRWMTAHAIGDVLCARTDHNQWGMFPEGHWLNARPQAGGGVLISSSIHRLDLLRWLVGEIVEVSNFQTTGHTRLEGEDVSVCILRFENGAIGQMCSVWCAQQCPWYESLWLYGSTGLIHTIGGNHLIRYDHKSPPHNLMVPSQYNLYTTSYSEEIRHFVTCMQTGRQALTDGREGRQSLAVVLAAYQSAREHRPVAVPHMKDAAWEGVRL